MRATDYGLIGHPLKHSLSPFIHRHLMQAAGLKGTYDLFDLPPEDLPSAIPGLMDSLAGFNCTIPHKQAVIPYLHELDPVAARIGAVNTVSERRGFNTDLASFLDDCPSMANHRILILGAGGVSRTMAFAAVSAGAAVWILARRPEQAQSLRADICRTWPDARVECPPAFVSWLYDDTHQSGDERPWGLLNGTPLGLWPKTAGLPFSTEFLTRFKWVYDTIYNPTATRLILAARSRGIEAKSGLGMLFGQALAAQRIWHPTACFPDDKTAEIRRLLSWEVLEQFPLTIVLVGFMGSGKTRVGKALANRLNCRFTDLDDVIEKSAGQNIPDIFSSQGEAAFRRLEQQQLEIALTTRCSQVLATGGGALIDPAVEAMVRRTPAVTVYLDLPLETIRERIGHGEGRPMIFGQAEERLTKLYNLRRPRYQAMADLRVDGRDEPGEIARKITFNLGLEGERS